MLNSWSFRKKLVALWLLTQIILTGITAFVAIKSATDFIEEDIVYQSKQIQPVLNSALLTPLLQRDYASIIAILRELTTSENIEEIIIKDNNGNLIAQEPAANINKKRSDVTPYAIEFPIQADGIVLGKATIAISRARLIETRSNILLYAAFIGLTSLFIFYLLALLISRYITKPISELATIANNISEGRFKTPGFSQRKDEVGMLQNAFQTMSTEISKRINDLNYLNIELEKRVQDRTESLQIARDELTKKVDELNLLGTVVDNSHLGISIADCQSPGIPLIYVNPAFTKITGHCIENSIGTKCRIFQNGIADPETMNQINDALKNKSACTVEFLDQRNNGEDFWNRLSIFPVLIDAAEPRYYVIFQDDISDLKKASAERESLLQEAQENQRLQSLGVLVAGLAHEINNPIGIALTATTHVSQTAANMRKNSAKLDNVQLTEFLEDEEIAFQLIFDNLRRASELVRGFKDIAIDRSLDEKKEINLQIYLQSIGQSLIPVLRKSYCGLDLDIDPKISLNVNTGSLGQLITNLVLNSTIHAFEGLKDCRIKIAGSQNTEHIILKIKDNGNGIPPNVLPNLFTPFYTTSRSKGGTGLGLYVSRQIATEILGGSLTVQNLQDKGCEFTLLIPRN